MSHKLCPHASHSPGEKGVGSSPITQASVLSTYSLLGHSIWHLEEKRRKRRGEDADGSVVSKDDGDDEDGEDADGNGAIADSAAAAGTSGPSHRCTLSHSGSNAGSLSHCAGMEMEPASQHSQDAANPVAPQRELLLFLIYQKTYPLIS